jgi:hypothetical protein
MPNLFTAPAIKWPPSYHFVLRTREKTVEIIQARPFLRTQARVQKARSDESPRACDHVIALVNGPFSRLLVDHPQRNLIGHLIRETVEKSVGDDDGQATVGV